jgi:hypothetical protein
MNAERDQKRSLTFSSMPSFTLPAPFPDLIAQLLDPFTRTHISHLHTYI